MNLASKFNQEVTVWPVTGHDGYGGFTFGAPYVDECRWQDKSELFRNSENEEETSMAIVYMDDSNVIDIGDYIAKGNLSAISDPSDESNWPSNVRKAFRIKQVGESTDVGALQTLRKVYL